MRRRNREHFKQNTKHWNESNALCVVTAVACQNNISKKSIRRLWLWQRHTQSSSETIFLLWSSVFSRNRRRRHRHRFRGFFSSFRFPICCLVFACAFSVYVWVSLSLSLAFTRWTNRRRRCARALLVPAQSKSTQLTIRRTYVLDHIEHSFMHNCVAILCRFGQIQLAKAVRCYNLHKIIIIHRRIHTHEHFGSSLTRRQWREHA